MIKILLSIGGLQLATMLVLLVRTKFLAIVLGPEGVGLMAVIDKVLAVLVQTISLSLPYAALRFLPELWNFDRSDCYRTFRAMSITLGGLAVVGGSFGVLMTLTVPALWGAQLAAYPMLLIAAFLTVPAQVFAPFIQNTFAGTMRHRASMLFGLAHAFIQVAAGLIGVLVAGLTGLYLTYAAAAAALLAPALVRVARPMRPTESSYTSWRSLLLPARVLRFSFALFGLTMLAPLAALYAHYAVLSNGGAAQAGWMQAAVGIALAVRGILGSAHATYLTPHLNKGGDLPERMQWAVRFQNTWCVIAGLLVPPLLLTIPLAVTVLYAPSFLPATQFVFLFVIAEVVGMLAGTYQGMIVAADHLRFYVMQNVASQLIYVGVAWITIPRWGIAGAATGAIASSSFLLVATSSFLALKMRLPHPWRTTALSLYLLTSLVVTGWIGTQGAALSAHSLATMFIVYGVLVAGLAAFALSDIRQVLSRLRARSKPGMSWPPK